MSKNLSGLCAKGIFVVGLASLFYFYEFMLRVSPNVFVDSWMSFFHTDAESFALMASAFYFAYAPMQIPIGMIGDHFGIRPVLIIAVIICACASLLLGHTSSLHVATSARFLMGMAASFAYLAPLMLAYLWIPHKYFATTTGGIQFLGALGAIFGGGPIDHLSRWVGGWQNSLNILGYIGLVLAVIFFFFIKERPSTRAPIKHLPMMTCLNRVIRCPQTWVIASLGFVFWAPMAAFTELWAGKWMEVSFHQPMSSMINWLSWVWLGIMVGGPLNGWICDTIGSRKPCIIVLLVLELIAFMSILYIPTHSIDWHLALFYFILGFSASGQCITFGLINDWHPAEISGTAVGFNNMAVILGGPILQPLIGWLLVHHTLAHHLTPEDFHHALMVVPIVLLAGLIICITLLKETHCQEQYEPS